MVDAGAQRGGDDMLAGLGAVDVRQGLGDHAVIGPKIPTPKVHGRGLAKPPFLLSSNGKVDEVLFQGSIRARVHE